MARVIEPECRYGHGPLLERVPDPQPGVKEASRGYYYVPSVTGYNVNMGLGYSFELWECQTCSYIELHDSDVK
ncbi:protein of unknown function [uncultured Woeseiaceae bacterium]|uniref:Uncharacterized protein n=1 Tax=uncultured Woeseiaceae bacterium TaxID=1983305 RepID=A0A7D9H577_9GAMM|nr:protein of unknown function [uncultured Woeseiaceae bacterium]